MTIGNKPVTISGNPSKPPNDNIKIKLKNNSTPTPEEACGRESITSQVLKGTNQPLWTLPPLYRTSSTPHLLCSFRGSQHCPHRERSRGCCRRGECTLHFCRGCNLILPTGEYPQGCGSGWHPRPCAPNIHIPTSWGFYKHLQPFPLLCLWFPHASKNPPFCPYQRKIKHMLEWLEARCSDSHLQQVFWETHQILHLLCAACFTGSATIWKLQQLFHRRCYCLHPAHCSLPPGK